MLLGHLLVNGVLYNAATDYTGETLAGEPFILADTLNANYQDITSVENLNLHINDVTQDFKFVRDEIKKLIEDAGGGNEDAGFDTLTTAEKDIAAALIIGSHSKRLAHVGSHSALKVLCFNYDNKMKPVRALRIDHARQELHTRLPNNALEAESEAGALIARYLRFGIEGTSEGDPEGLMDWIFGRTGTTYDAAGLLQKPWATDPAGYTLTAVCNMLYDIIHKGLY